MTISVGSPLPEVTLRKIGADGSPEPVTTTDFFAGRKIVLFAVPGAFTPTCHINHLPGYIEHAAAIKAQGIDAIAVTAVNDPFVMRVWREASGVTDGITFLSDGNGDLARALDLILDASGNGLGQRSQRYAMVVDNGVVSYLAVEEKASTADVSSAESLLAHLNQG